VADHLLDETVADRHAAGDGDMRADRTRQFEEAQQSRPAAIDFGDAPDQEDDLRDDEDHIENRAWTDRRHHRNALGRRRDFLLGFRVQRAQQSPLGDVDEIAPVDDGAHRLGRLRASRRRFGTACVECDQLADQRARRVAIIAGSGRSKTGMQARNAALAQNGDKLARGDRGQRDQGQRAEADPDPSQRLRFIEQGLDELREPEP
jgi:hypothetical protein